MCYGQARVQHHASKRIPMKTHFIQWVNFFWAEGMVIALVVRCWMWPISCKQVLQRYSVSLSVKRKWFVILLPLGLQFTRLQGTPDLLPSDVVCSNVFQSASSSFTFRVGSIFTQFLLFDEMNRATPRTQSALLEAMAERQVTVDWETRPLDKAFFVIATEKPLESQGVFSLPEGQIDHFPVRLRMGYQGEHEELEMVQRLRLCHTLHKRTY